MAVSEGGIAFEPWATIARAFGLDLSTQRVSIVIEPDDLVMLSIEDGDTIQTRPLLIEEARTIGKALVGA